MADPDGSADAPASVLQRYLEAASREDVEAMVALTDPSYEFGTPRSRLEGHAALRRALAAPRAARATWAPERWFAARERVVCVVRTSFRNRATDEPAGEATRFLWAEVRDGHLRRLRSGFTAVETALADAGLSDADELTGSSAGGDGDVGVVGEHAVDAEGEELA